MTKSQVEIFYDGDCPFCSNYVSLVRLRETYDVTLIDLRTRPDLVSGFLEEGMDVSEGMIVRFSRVSHYGADALVALSMASSANGVLNRITAMVFRHPKIARALYPIMKFGRRVTLTLLGLSPKIQTAK